MNKITLATFVIVAAVGASGFTGTQDQPKPAWQEKQTPAEVLAELKIEFHKMQQNLLQRHMRANSDEERRALPDINIWPRQQIVPRVAKAAERYAGTPEAVPFLLCVVEYGSRVTDHRLPTQAIDTLLQKHAEDNRLEAAADYLPRYEEALGEKGMLDRANQLLQATPHANVKAACLYAVIRIKPPKGDALVGALKEVVKADPVSSSAQRAKNRLFELENLQVGHQAPEIAATLLDGSGFKLSDYRGEVVVLDFWTIHCGVCIGKMPRDLERARRHKDDRYVHIGIHSDAIPAAQVREFVKEHEIAWPIVLDKSSSGVGPLGTAWNVQGWPTIYVLDDKGVIRFKSVRGETLDRAVAKLLTDMSVSQ